MMSRETSSTEKVAARPESIELKEKITIAVTSMALRLPVASDSALISKPDSAQVNDSAEPSIPTCVLLSCRSLATNGPRNAIALRSKNTIPNMNPSTTIICVS